MLRTLIALVFMTAPESLSAHPRGLDHNGLMAAASAVNPVAESHLLLSLDKDLAIVSHRRLQAGRPPVLLVHGLDGSPRDLADLADRLDEAGHQVLLVLYRDRERVTSASGRALADAMVRLRAERYPVGEPLDIVAHSMGGVVARAALNTLQDPAWMGRAERDRSSTPRAGFGRIRLRTIDTPWDGFAHEPRVMAPLAPVVRLIFGALGWAGAWEMRANSKTLEHLFDPALPLVDIKNVSVRTEGKPDAIRSLPEIGVHERRALARFVLERTLPPTARLRNAARSLTQDSRVAQLESHLREALKSSPRRDPAEVFSQSYDQVMPRPVGTHTSVLTDNRERADDLVDLLVADLAVTSTAE